MSILRRRVIATTAMVALFCLGCGNSKRIPNSCVSTSECPTNYACIASNCISLTSQGGDTTAPTPDATADSTSGNEQNDLNLPVDGSQGCSTTTISMTYNGSLGTASETTPIYVVLSSKPLESQDDAIAYELLTTNGGSVTFPNLAAGTYYVSAIFDHNGDGPGPGDPFGRLLEDGGSTTLKTQTTPFCLSMFFDDAQLMGGGQGEKEPPYQVFSGGVRVITTEGVSDSAVLHTHASFAPGSVTAITLDGPSGNYVFDMQTCGERQQDQTTLTDCGRDFVDVTVTVGDTYTFTVTLADGNTQTVSHTLTTAISTPIMITTPSATAFSPEMLGKEIAVVWTLPPGITGNSGIALNGSVCTTNNDCTRVDGTVTSTSTGTITLPGLSGAVGARIEVGFHEGDARSICAVEFN